jgi:AraC-like DNA-binding protein
MDKAKQPLLFFSTEYFMYIGRAVDTIVHDHHAIQIAISFEDKIEMILSDSTFRLKGLIIDSDVPHECRTGDTTFLLINIDPECEIGFGLKKVCLAGQRTAALSEPSVEKLLKELKPLLLASPNMDSIFTTTLQFLRELSRTGRKDELDDRIIKILEVLNRPGHSPVKIKELAELVFLSPSRLIHLFTMQVGIPIRKYILWARLLKSLQQILNSTNFTSAALEGGFSDAAHFNRTFKRMFGLNPTLLLKNSQIIQAYLQ